jgi:hypothetical protein
MRQKKRTIFGRLEMLKDCEKEIDKVKIGCFATIAAQ